GRGPTTDICPQNTLKNCGNSSILVFLMKAPILVILISPLVAICLSESLLMAMERNFKQANSSEFIPFRYCLKNIGPLDSNRIKSAINGVNHESTKTITRPAQILSKARFK